MQKKPAVISVVFYQQISIVFIRTFLLFAIVFAVKANAACKREDVGFYLDKGFNHEQIIKLCVREAAAPQISNTPQTQSNQVPRQYPLANNSIESQQSGFGLYGHPDAVFLATAIEGYDVEVTDAAIIFSRKDCFDYGLEDLNGFRERACPDVKYIIRRGGLRVVERDNGLFGLGSTALFISGDIRADIIDLKGFDPKHQAEIKSVVDAKTDKLKINVRSGMPQSKVEAILLKLAG